MPHAMSFATLEDLKEINRWVSDGCLIPFAEEKFDPAQCLADCSDGRRPHIKRWISETYYRRTEGCSRDDNLSIFRYSAHGIAMRFGLGNPLNPDDAAFNFLEPQLKQAQRFVNNGGIRQFNLLHHWPCGAAKEAGISLSTSIAWALLSKARLKHTRLFPEVSTLLWVDIGPDENAVYRMKLERFVNHFRQSDLPLCLLFEQQRTLLGQTAAM
ncbi:MAG: hypothetical protein WBO92_02490 [Candidatus Moraniibacteriota bacterium]